MEIERLGFGAAMLQVRVQPARGFLDQLHIVHAAVHLVRGRVNENRVAPRKPRGFERVERAQAFASKSSLGFVTDVVTAT
jgi:hypothetical protein